MFSTYFSIDSNKTIGVNDPIYDWSREEDTEDHEIEGEVEENDNVEESNDIEIDEGRAELEAVGVDGDSVKYDAFFITESGEKIYKTTCLKKIFKSEPLSKDRLKRIRGMSSYADSMAAVTFGNVDDSMLVVGDPLVYNKKGSYVLANIFQIKVGNKKVKSIDLSSTDLSSSENTEFILKDISTEEINGKIYWSGQYLSTEKSVDARQCLPIHPQVELDPPLGMSKFFFDAQLIRDIGVDFLLSHNENPPSTNVSQPEKSCLERKCFHCRLSIRRRLG